MMLVPLQEVRIRDFSGFMKQPNCLCVDGMPPNPSSPWSPCSIAPHHDGIVVLREIFHRSGIFVIFSLASSCTRWKLFQYHK